jgi:hypothetical protein
MSQFDMQRSHKLTRLSHSAALHRHAQGWNQRARVMGKELDSQNEQIDRTRGKTENLENEMDYLDAKMKRQLKRN